MIAGGVVVTLLAAGIFTLGSLRIPLYPDEGMPAAALFAVSLFIFAAFMVFTLILMRSLVRLWAERRSGQLGSRFKTKMVLGAMGVSLLPVVFMFFFSYALVNRTLNLWFPRPLEIANEQSQKLIADFSQREFERLRCTQRRRPNCLSGQRKGSAAEFLPGTDPPVFWLNDATGKVQVLRGTPGSANTAGAAAG